MGVEWRFVYFSARNADLIVKTASCMLWDLVHGGKPKHPEIGKYIDALEPTLAVLFPDGRPSV